MEVLLKKAKITKSVIAQSLLGGYSLYLGHPNYEVLGWCNFIDGKNSRRYILLYNKAESAIVKLHAVREGEYEIVSKSEQTRKPGVPYEDWYWPMFHSLIVTLAVPRTDVTISKKQEDLASVEADRDKLKVFLRKVYQKGQIYIYLT